MTEPIDVYSDAFQVSTGPFGSTLNFQISQPTPPAPGKMAQPELLATIRMSLEHLKLMTFVLRKQIITHEQQTGVNIQVPVQVLNQMGIGQDDWSPFWKHS
ncbi:hypothetical protein ACFLYR_09165 [Chloroflexota bacterium]